MANGDSDDNRDNYCNCNSDSDNDSGGDTFETRFTGKFVVFGRSQ
jgi:hypothetical protein